MRRLITHYTNATKATAATAAATALWQQESLIANCNSQFLALAINAISVRVIKTQGASLQIAMRTLGSLPKSFVLPFSGATNRLSQMCHCIMTYAIALVMLPLMLIHVAMQNAVIAVVVAVGVDVAVAVAVAVV